jgi:nucleobase:cation symporter-1, NCS1 family
MEKLKGTKIAHWSNRLAVESEDNLTNAQLMLFNHDLKPVCAFLIVGFQVANLLQG